MFKKKPEAQLLGSAIGMKVMEEVPYVKGLDKWLGDARRRPAYLRTSARLPRQTALSACHIENLTPEAVEQGEGIIAEGAQVYVIDDAGLSASRQATPSSGKIDAAPQRCALSAART